MRNLAPHCAISCREVEFLLVMRDVRASSCASAEIIRHDIFARALQHLEGTAELLNYAPRAASIPPGKTGEKDANNLISLLEALLQNDLNCVPVAVALMRRFELKKPLFPHDADKPSNACPTTKDYLALALIFLIAHQLETDHRLVNAAWKALDRATPAVGQSTAYLDRILNAAQSEIERW